MSSGTVEAILAAPDERLERAVAVEVARVGYARTTGRLLLAIADPDRASQRPRLERALRLARKFPRPRGTSPRAISSTPARSSGEAGLGGLL